MINFPDAPAVDQVFQDWKWDGSSWNRTGRAPEPAFVSGYPAYGWRNGAVELASDKTVLELAGLSTIDYQNKHFNSVTRSCIYRISAVIFSASSQLGLRWSNNGSTWSTATDAYRYAGWYHGSTGGYANLPQSDSSYIPMYYGTGTQTVYPQMVDAFVDRVKGRAFIKASSHGASSNILTMLIKAWGYSAGSGANYLRFLSHNGVAFGDGSFVVVEEMF